MSSSKSKWERFFKDAGIPSKMSLEYASKFCDNRIRLDMLEDLNKEVLNELGVKAIGDVIAILRHTKKKQAEISRERSSSPEIQIAQSSQSTSSTTTDRSKQSVIKQSVVKATAVPSKPTSSSSQSQDQKQLIKNISMTVKSDAKSPSSSSLAKAKQSRKTLSERFCEYERETKKKKGSEQPTEEVEKQTKTKPATAASGTKTKPTIFTIQLPSKSSSISNFSSAPPVVSLVPSKSTISSDKKDIVKPSKVTLVPAQGKTLDRNKKSTSIFDRLDKTLITDKKKQVKSLTKTVAIKPKEKQKGIFSRLGNIDSDQEESTAPSLTLTSKIRSRDSTVVSPLNQSQSFTSTTSKNVFSRLGDR